jgi:hypothetical protein
MVREAFFMTAMIRPRALAPLSVLLMAAMLAGCGFNPKPQVIHGSVYASEFGGLKNHSVAIVIYTEPATLYEFPRAREEISNFVATQMRLELPTTQVLSYLDVIDWQNSTMNWFGLTERDIGRHFSVDKVLFIEVLDYSTKRPVGWSDMQGRLRAKCKIVDCTAGAPEGASPGVSPAEWSGTIDTVWPTGGPLDPTQINEDAVRLRTLEIFSQTLVGLFSNRSTAAAQP